MEKHERMLRSYKRTHKGVSQREVEEAKILKERAGAARLNRKADRLLKRAVSEPEELADSIIEEHDVLAHRVKKVKRNAKSHKKRLAELKKNKEFS